MTKDIMLYDNFIIFGAGKGKILHFLIEKYSSKIVGIIDNDKNKTGKEIKGKKIFSVDILNTYNLNDTVVISSLYNKNEEIREQFVKLGWGNNFVVAREELDSINSFEFRLFECGVSANNFVPNVLHIELSGLCNCKCVYCPFHGYQNSKVGHKKNMKWDVLKAICEQMKKINTFNTINTTGNGEIFLNPEWFEMLQYVLSQISVPKVIMYTNGMLLNEENIKKILSLNVEKIILEISIDGRTPKDNDKYRIGSKYNTIKSNIERLISLKSNSNKNLEVIITNCYPLKKNELKDTNKIFNVDVPQYIKDDFPGIKSTSKAAFVYKTENDKNNETLLDYVVVRHPLNNPYRCTNLFHTLCINNAGDLIRCSCGNVGIDNAIGNVLNDDVLDLWYNDKSMNMVRNAFVECDGLSLDFCDGCPFSGINEYKVMIE